jgi:hypothetical protein
MNLITNDIIKTDFTGMIYDAFKIIAENGATCTIEIATRATYNPTNDNFGTATLATYYHTYAVLSTKKLWKLDPTLIDASEQMYLVPAYCLPKLDEETNTVKITIGSVTKIIEDIDAVKPNGTCILFKCKIRN